MLRSAAGHGRIDNEKSDDDVLHVIAGARGVRSLQIRRGIFAQPNLYTTFNNLGPDTILGTILLPPFIVFIP